MASAKQIAWRKKFARMSKAGVFRKKSKVRKPDGSRQSDFIPQYEFDEAQRKKEGKPSIFGKTKNDDGYYITKEGSLFVLRQKRFKDRLDRGKKEHPHDVMAMGRTRAEINSMRKMITKS